GKRLQKFQHSFGCLAAFLGVHDQWDPRRSGHMHNVREGGDSRFHDVEPAKHCCCEDVHPRIMLEQVFGDVAATHVRGTAQCGFEIPIAPIDCPVDQIRFFGQHCFHRCQIDVTGNHETL